MDELDRLEKRLDSLEKENGALEKRLRSMRDHFIDVCRQSFIWFEKYGESESLQTKYREECLDLRRALGLEREILLERESEEV